MLSSLTTLQAADRITRENRMWSDDATAPMEGAGVTITVAFPESFETALATMSPEMIEACLFAMRSISQVSGISFVIVDPEDSQTADINFAVNDESDVSYASISYNSVSGSSFKKISQATIMLAEHADYEGSNSYGHFLAIHELSHALGLSHPGDYGMGAQSYDSQAAYVEDTVQYSMMSYWHESHTGGDFRQDVFIGEDVTTVGGAVSTLMLHDIAAFQKLYGANMHTRNTDTVYGFNSNTQDETWSLTDAEDHIIAAVWDAGGIDTLDVSGYSVDCRIDLEAEAFSSFGGLSNNFAIASGVTIENAFGGSGDDMLSGNQVANRLDGNAGDDLLFGHAGNDVLYGGNGDDTLAGGAGMDLLFGGHGHDTARFDGPEEDYLVSFLPDGSISVAHQFDPNDADILFGVEELEFDPLPLGHIRAVCDMPTLATSEFDMLGTTS